MTVKVIIRHLQEQVIWVELVSEGEIISIPIVVNEKEVSSRAGSETRDKGSMEEYLQIVSKHGDDVFNAGWNF